MGIRSNLPKLMIETGLPLDSGQAPEIKITAEATAMPASADRIRREVDGHIRPTVQNKGLTLTTEVSAMDTWMFRERQIGVDRVLT